MVKRFANIDNFPKPPKCLRVDNETQFENRMSKLEKQVQDLKRDLSARLDRLEQDSARLLERMEKREKKDT